MNFRRIGLAILISSFFLVTIYNLLFVSSGVWLAQLSYFDQLSSIEIDVAQDTTDLFKNISFIPSADVVIFESLERRSLKYVGGTGHWFHMAEHLFPYLESLTLKKKLYNASHIIFLFREKYAAEGLVPFTRFLITTILADSSYQYISFAWTSHSIYYSKNDSLNKIIFIKELHFSFMIDLKSQSPSELFSVNNIDILLEKLSLTRTSYDIYAQFLMDISWDAGEHTKGKWISNLHQYQFFTSKVSHICSIKSNNNNINNNTIHEDMMDDAFVWLSPDDPRRKYMRPAKISNSDLPKTIIIYQRDRSRILINANDVENKLRNVLDESATNDKHRKWTVKQVLHSNDRSPCDTIQLISQATVLITPHGFQCSLLIFQPLDSVLVEIQPYMYFMPHYYGTIQSLLRHYIPIQRSYLTEESTSDSILLSVFASAGILTRKICSKSSFCRYISRLQNVRASDAFISKVANYVNKHFV